VFYRVKFSLARLGELRGRAHVFYHVKFSLSDAKAGGEKNLQNRL
jgi:hypothetical protein